MSVNKFYPINIQNTNSIVGTYGNVSLLVNANEETKGNTILNRVAVGKATSGTYEVDVSGNINFSGSLYQNGVIYGAGGSQSLAQVLSIGNSAGTNDIDMSNNDIYGIDKIKAKSADISGNVFVDGGTIFINTTQTPDMTARINYKDTNFDYNFLSENSSKLSISLGSNTTDVNNKFYTISIGNGANRDLVSGTSNVAIGVGALINNTTGSNNVAVGYGPLTQYYSGSYNTAIGFRAGNDQFGLGYDSSYCTFLGTEARASANIVNSCAIGYGAIVDESNKIVLGNTSNQKVKVNGALETTGNIDLTSDLAKIQFTFNTDPSNTIIDRHSVTTTSAIVKNLTFTNVSSNITITNWNASSPVVAGGTYALQYTGTGTYTGTSGVITSGDGTNAYNFYVQRGQNFVFYVTYYPAGTDQAFVLQTTPNGIIRMKTINYSLNKGQYAFTFWMNAQNTGGTISFTASVKTSPSNTVLDQIVGISVYDAYPEWVQFEMTFNLTQTTDVYFEWESNTTTFIYGAYVLLTGLVLRLTNGMIITDTVTNKTATIGGSQTILNNTTINESLDVTGGASITGGLTTNSTYGTSNLAINTLMGSTVGANSSANNVGVGSASMQAITTATNNTALGNGSLSLLTTGSNHIGIGKGVTITNGLSNSIAIGAEQIVRGSDTVAIGRYTQLTLNQGVIGNFNVAIGTDVLGANRNNGYGVLSASESVAIGYQSQYFNADRYNTSVGQQTLYNLLGANGVTSNGNNGFICQYNTALGYRAGFSRNIYNNCTFIGANADASVENLINATAIGYNCIVDVSNCIQLGSNSEKVKISGDLEVATINGLPPASSINLSQVLTNGNSAGSSSINMNFNNITNINQLSVIKTTTGITNPAILLETTNVNTEPINMAVKRIKPSPFGATNDLLFVINVEGTNNVGGQVEYTRQESTIANPSASIPQGQISFFTRNGTGGMDSYETLRLNNNLSHINSGLRTGYVHLALTANTTIPDTAIGSMAYIVSSTATYTITLPSVSAERNGAFFYLHNLSGNQHTLSHANPISGNYGAGATTLNMNSGQSYLFTMQSSAWRCVQVFGVPYQYTRYHSTTQTGISTSNVNGLFNTACASVDLNTNAWSLDTWNGTRLAYNATTGVFTNNTGFTMVLQVQLRIHTPTTTTPRYAGILRNATRQNYGGTPAWYQLGQGGTTMIPFSDTFVLKNGETFNVVYQAGASSTFGSTSSVLHNRITITRLG